jgi:SanA protein
MSRKRSRRREWHWLAAMAMLGLLLALPRWLIERKYARQIMAPADLPAGEVALVFGAGLSRIGQPSPVLADRVRTAAGLYHAGKVEHLLLSGSVGPGGYDEPLAMCRQALDLGVPSQAIILDRSGDRTFETCRHASQALGLRQVVLVTQRYHLPRALATCDALGLQAVGVSADQRRYGLFSQLVWQIREIPATLRALWDGFQAAGKSHPAPQVNPPRRGPDGA